jgi:hypothetical protein
MLGGTQDASLFSTMPVLSRFVTLATVSCCVALAAPTVFAEGPQTAAVKTAPPSPSAAEPAGVDPQAKALLARSREYLSSLNAFHVRAETTQDVMVGAGGDYKLQKAEVVDLVVQRPGRMRIDITGDDRNQLIVDDGKTLTAFSRPEKSYTTMSVLPTLKETLDAASARHDVKVPLVDLMFMAAGEDFASSAGRARDVGPSRCGTAPCEHLAFRGKKVDWQVWIESGDKPVPLKVVVTTRDAPGQPQYTALFAWDPAPKIDDTTFAFTPPPDAMQMGTPKTPSATSNHREESARSFERQP